jgi:hypothetical protein
MDLYAPRRKRSARLLPLFHTTRQKDYYVRHCAHGRYGSHNHTSHITQPPGRGVHISFAGSVCTTTTHESRRCTGHGIHTSVPRHATRPNCAKMCAHARRNNRPTRKHNLRPRPPQRRIGFRARCQARVTQAATSPAAEIAATHDYTLEDSRAKHSNTSTRTCADPPHILRGGIAAQRRPRKARS